LKSIDILTIGNITEDRIFKEDNFFSSIGGPSFYASKACIKYGVKSGVISISSDELKLEDCLPDNVAFPQNRIGHTIFENHYINNMRAQRVVNFSQSLNICDLIYPVNYAPPKLIFYCPVLNEVTNEFLELFPDSIKVCNLQGWMRTLDSQGNVSIKKELPDLDFSIFHAVIMSEHDVDYDNALKISESCKLVCITKGEQGSTLIVDNEIKNYGTVRVVNVDETGAGDVWAITFSIFYFIFKKHINDSAMFANTAASFSIKGIGDSEIPYLDKLLNLKKW